MGELARSQTGAIAGSVLARLQNGLTAQENSGNPLLPSWHDALQLAMLLLKKGFLKLSEPFQNAARTQLVKGAGDFLESQP